MQPKGKYFCGFDYKGELIEVEGRKMPIREVLGAEIIPGMARSFPVEVSSNSVEWNHNSINWDNPI